jgi:hypothetical protein
MQTITLLGPTQLSSAITGSAVSYDPIIDSVGTAMIVLKQTGATPGNPSGAATIEIQGAYTATGDWVTLHSISSAALTKPLGVATAFGSGIGGCNTGVAVIQTLPFMRVCTSASITNGSQGTISVVIGNG